MEMSKNPFSNLYITESIPAKQFVEVFSSVLLQETETHLLFQPGNVIVRGLQGTGKSALLNLLKPEILIAFLNSDEAWPLPSHCSKFLSASITLRSSGALDFGQRSFSPVDKKNNDKITGLFFGDYLNYWIIDDLLKNVELLLSPKGRVLADHLNLNRDAELLEKFALDIAKNTCWFGFLEEVNSFQELRKAIQSRIVSYESFLNYNSDLPPKFLSTKTRPGDPIGVTAEALKSCGIVPHDTPVFISIDQFEDLMDLEKDHKGEFPTIFRSVIMKMLGNRDKRASYRIGARPYSISSGNQGFGNNAFTEEMREFKFLDIGELLKKPEYRLSLFPNFCDDVLMRRLKYEGFETLIPDKKYVRHMFGPHATPEAKIRKFVKNVSKNLITPKGNWPKGSEKFLRNLAKKDPISAKMGEAWLRQKNKKGELSLESIEQAPWMRKPWWKKERKQLAMLQVFSSSNQRMNWYGSTDILALSGNNIIVFLSLCQFIWSEYLKGNKDILSTIPENIEPNIQAMGIHNASEHWFRKVKAEPKGGDARYAFVHILATFLKTRLRADRSMSYPGENGFSLPVHDLEETEVVGDFLAHCVGFGVLETADHTPKVVSRGLSKKWYLTSILTPYFQLPTPHIKEPYYASLKDMFGWMEKAGVIDSNPSRIYSTKSRVREYEENNQMIFDLNKREDN